MAAEIELFNQSKAPMAEAIAAMKQIRDGRNRLEQIRNAMMRYRNGADNGGADVTAGGNDPSNYSLLASSSDFQAGGFATAAAAARASFLEIDALVFKLTTDSTIDTMKTALDQCCAKHGV